MPSPPPTSSSPPTPPVRTWQTHTPTVAVIVAVVAGLYLARQVFIPIALAGLLTFLLAPLVRRLERIGVGRALGVAIVTGATALVLAGVGWVIQAQVSDLVAKLPEYRSNIHTKLEGVRLSGSREWARAGEIIAEIGSDISKATRVTPETPETREVVAVKVTDVGPTPWANAKTLLGPIFTPLVTTGLVAVFTIFMLLKREDVRDRFIRLAGPRSLHLTTQAMDDAAHRVNRYLVMQLASNVAAGVAVGIGLWALGLPSPAVWGVLVMIMRFIPFVGMWIAAALPFVLSVAESPDWTTPLLTLGVFAAVEIVTANFIEPVVLGTSTGLSALAILVSAVFWGWLWGGVGLLLATPLTVCVAVIGRHVPHFAFLDVLLGAEAALAPEARLYQRLLAGDVDEANRVVSDFSKGRTAAEVYDGLVLPALRMAEEDRHHGDLDEGRAKFVDESMQTIVETLSAAYPAAGGARRVEGDAPAVLCVPVWDAADGLASAMLAHVVEGAGVRVDELSAESLSGEIVAAVLERKPAVVCLSSVPPGAVSPARGLYRRLKARTPAVHIVVTLWDPRIDAAGAAETLGLDGTDRVVTSMSEALAVVKALAAVGAKEEPGVVVPTRGATEAVRG